LNLNTYVIKSFSQDYWYAGENIRLDISQAVHHKTFLSHT